MPAPSQPIRLARISAARVRGRSIHNVRRFHGRFAWMALTLVGLLVVSGRSTPASAATSSTLNPVADSYIDSSARNSNFGTASTLIASASVRRALLKFDTQFLAGATLASASLAVWAQNSTSSSGGFEVHPEADTWTEGSLTWNNQPLWNATILATSARSAAGSWITIPLPVSAINTAGNTNFGLRYSSSGINAQFASREDALNKPRLLISYTLPGAPAATPTPTTPPALPPTPTPSPTPAPPPPSAPGLCGFLSAPSTIAKSMVIWFENKDYAAIVGSANAPYLNNTVKAQCGLATNYSALTHPSLPNYLAASDGFTDFVGRDCSPSATCQSGRDNLYTQVSALGKQWRGYAEDMPSNCFKSNAGTYAPRHNPALYYTNLTDCAVRDVPSGTTTAGTLLTDVQAGSLPDLAFVVPNLCNSTHDCPVATGDTWLSKWIPVITSGEDYQLGRLAIFVAWDEGGGTANLPSHVPLFVLSAFTAPGTQSAMTFDHYALLRTQEEILGTPAFLGGAATASSLRAAFNL